MLLTASEILIGVLCLAIVAAVTGGVFYHRRYQRLAKAHKELKVRLDETSRGLIAKHLEMVDSNERLVHTLQVKTDFIGVASHQLRTPLTGIKWGLLNLTEGVHGQLNGDQSKIANEVLNSVCRMNHLVNELLDFVKSDAGRRSARKRAVDLDGLVEETVNQVVQDHPEKRIEMIQTLTYGREPVLIDADLFNIALTNLINNAFYYTPAGKRVFVRTEERDGKFYFEVKDEGIGIPKEKADVIFGKFKRTSDAVQSNRQGIGLGLHITKNIIDGMQGSISFNSEGAGQGATFFFTIPITRPKKPERGKA